MHEDPQELLTLREVLAVVQDALDACEARFRNIIDRNADGVLIVDASGVVRFVNPAAERLLARPAEALLGKAFGFPVVAGERTEIDILPGDRTCPPRVAEIRVEETEWEGERAYLTSLRDVTERKRAAERLRESEERYRLLAQNTVDVIWLMDMDLTFTYVNPAVETMTGFTPEAWVGSSLEEHCDAENFAKLRHVIQTSLDSLPGNEGLVVEATMLKENGDPIPVEITERVVVDESGQPVGFQGIVRDITERKCAEEKIEKLARFPAENPNPVLRIAREGRVLYANSAAALLLDAESGRESSVLTESWRRVVREAFVSGQNQDVEIKCDGRIFSLVFAPVMEEGYVNVYGLDITKRKEAEDALWKSQQMLRLIMDHIPHSIFWKDKDSVYLGCNRAFAEDAGVEDPEEIIGHDDFDMPWVEQAELYRADDRYVVETGEPRLRYEEPQTTPTGEKIWLQTSKVPLRDVSGEIIGMLGMYEDITVRKEAEMRLRQYTTRLETLHQIDQAILEARSTEEIAAAALQGLKALITFQDLSMMLFEGETEHAVILVGQIDQGLEIKSTQTPLSWFRPLEALRQGESHVIDDLEVLDDPTPAERRLLERKVRSHLSVPLLTPDGLIGALNFAAAQPRAFTETDVEIASEIANQLAIALQQARLHEQTQLHAVELERRVDERTAELRKLVNLMAGREIRMNELKDVIKRLRGQLVEAGLAPVADDPLLGEGL